MENAHTSTKLARQYGRESDKQIKVLLMMSTIRLNFPCTFVLTLVVFSASVLGQSDLNLTKAATARLNDGRVVGVSVVVRQGVATLTGAVKDVTVKVKAENIVAATPGIKHVVNNCTMLPLGVAKVTVKSGLGIYKKPLNALIPANAGRFNLLRRADGPFPVPRNLKVTDAAAGIYVSNDNKALQFLIINFGDLTSHDKAMKWLVTDDGRRPNNLFSEGLPRVKNGKVVGKRYDARFEGASVALSFWTNGSVFVFLQGTMNTKPELNLKPANNADLSAFENALTY